jgi:hypothetical protein
MPESNVRIALDTNGYHELEDRLSAIQGIISRAGSGEIEARKSLMEIGSHIYKIQTTLQDHAIITPDNHGGDAA